MDTHFEFVWDALSEPKSMDTNSHMDPIVDSPALDVVQGVQAHDEDSNSNSSPGSHDGGSARLKPSSRSDSEPMNGDIKEISDSMECIELVLSEEQHRRQISDKKKGSQLAVSSAELHVVKIENAQNIS
eukprot:Gb_11845 [translate_table: standard]